MHIFLLIFISSRIIYFFQLKENFSYSITNNNYINQNFLELFIFNHTIPNGHLVIEKLINLTNLHSFSFFYFLNLVYTIFFCLFLNDLLKQIKFNNTLRIILLVIVSIILIPYESWRVNHHDHISLFIISYMFWSLFHFINNGRSLNHLIFALILLNFFYTLGFVYSLIFFISLILIKKYKLISFNKYYLTKFFLLFFFILIIFLKNYYSSSIFASTSMGGANLIQRTIHAIGEKKYQNLIEVKKQTFPNWWINITEEIFLTNKTDKLLDNRISNLAHGTLDKNILSNFLKQKNIITKSGQIENELEIIISKEIRNFKHKDWLYDYGYQQNLISTKYQSFGNIVFYEACKLYPYDMIFGNIGNKGIILTSLQMITYSGLLPNYYESKDKYSLTLLNYLNNIFRIIILLILLITPYILIKKIKYKSLKKIDIFYLISFLSISLIILITSTITCCENPRMLVMHFFIIFFICILNLNYIFKFNKFHIN